MKYIILFNLLLGITLIGQEDSMRTFASAGYEVKAYLVPTQDHIFSAVPGTRVRLTVALKNGGTSRFILNTDKFLTGALLVKAKEIEFPIHIEKFSQESIVATKQLTLKNRIANVNGMEEEEAVKYARLLFPDSKLPTKADLLKKLNGDLSEYNGLKNAAVTFDKSKVVDPGANLFFAASAILPPGDDDPKDFCDLSIRIVNSDGKHISIPVRAIFY